MGQGKVCTGAESPDKLCGDAARNWAIEAAKLERQISGASTTRSPSLSSHGDVEDVEDSSANDGPCEALRTDLPTDDLAWKCMGMELHENEFVGANVSGGFHCSYCSQ